MTSGREDDALSWGGDDDPTLDVGVTSHAESPALPDGWTAVGKGAEQMPGAAAPVELAHADVASSDTDTPDKAAPEAEVAPGLGNAALVSLGVFGGIFLLYAIGWYLGATRLAAYQEATGYGIAIGLRTLADDFMFLAWVMLATLAAPIWFITAVYLTQGARFWKRFVALLGGAVLLVPWPFLMLGAVGA